MATAKIRSLQDIEPDLFGQGVRQARQLAVATGSR
jgi:hypothetical protein